jgi:hypothetical protein
MYSLFFRSLSLYYFAYFDALKFDKKRHTPFNFQRLLFLTVLFPPFLALQIIHQICFVLDDVFFPDYKSHPCDKLLFIIGIPRSGTTFIHRTIASSSETSTFSTWEAIFAPAICEKKCLKFFNRVDNFFGKPFRSILNFIIRLFGDDFHNIHSVGLDAPEEDYLTLLPIGSCLIVLFAFPNSPKLKGMIDFKNMADKEKREILAFYKKNIQRHLYGKNHNRLFISKNAAFCTWLPELKLLFPDAQFILTIRDPETAIPTQLNALKSARAVFGSDPNGIITRAIIQQSFEKNYTSVFNFLKSTSKMNCALIQQEELRKDSIGILTKAINQLAITLPIESIQVKTPNDNKTIHKKNASVPQDPIDPSITKTYKRIIELNL